MTAQPRHDIAASPVGLVQTDELEAFELAFARLEWVRSAGGCLHLPAQREALEWHIARCGEALTALDRVTGPSPTHGHDHTTQRAGE